MLERYAHTFVMDACTLTMGSSNKYIASRFVHWSNIFALSIGISGKRSIFKQM